MNDQFELVDEYRADLLRQYAAAAAQIRQALERLPDEALHRPLSPGGWSPHQEMAYLRDIEKHLFWPILQALLTKDAPLLESAFPRQRAGWAAGYSAAEPLEQILDEWAAIRRQEWERVQGLPRPAWNRTGRHPRWGVRTLQWWVELSLAGSRDLWKLLRRF